MDAGVRNSWPEWSAQFEANVAEMYLDIKGLVTGGVGNLLDDRSGNPPQSVFDLPWRRKSDFQLATREQVGEEWHRVKGRQDLKDASLSRRLAITTLYLAPSDIETLVFKTFDKFANILKQQFPDLDTWPPSAQRALMSMAWARGPHAFSTNYPRFTAACLVRRWDIAAAECKIAGEETNKGLKPRNAINKTLFLDAWTKGVVAPPAPTSIAHVPWWMVILNFIWRK